MEKDNIFIELWGDGGVRGNGKEESIGAYAFILSYKDKYYEYSYAERNATNNQQELLAIINGLKYLKKTTIPVKVYTDSAYCIGCTTWIKSWKKNGWLTATKEPVKNKQSVIWLDEQLQRFDNVEFIKVKGHSGVPLNERCDLLLNIAMDNLEKEIIKNGR